MNPLPLALLGILGHVQTPLALTLDDALRIAFQHRPSVHAAQLRVAQAEFLGKSLAAPPSARLELQATSNRDLFGNDDDVALTQPVDLFGRRSANRSLGDAQLKLAKAGLHETLEAVQSDVVTRYSESVAAAQLLSTAKAQLELSQRLFDATQKRADGGAIPPVQVKRVSLEVQRARQTLASREAAHRAALRRLVGALGSSIGSVQVADFAPIPTPQVEIDTVRQHRSDLITLTAQLSITEANSKVSDAQFQPELEISARTSPYSYGARQPAGIRAMLSLPVFDYGRKQNERSAGKLAERAEREALADAVTKAQAELEAVNVEVAAAAAQASGLSELLVETRELVRVSDVGYREGATTLLEVLEAARTLREIEESLIESRLRLAQAQEAYLRATGTLLFGDPK